MHRKIKNAPSAPNSLASATCDGWKKVTLEEPGLNFLAAANAEMAKAFRGFSKVQGSVK